MIVLCNAAPNYCPRCGKKTNYLDPDEFYMGLYSECQACGCVLWQYIPEEDALYELASEYGNLRTYLYD